MKHTTIYVADVHCPPPDGFRTAVSLHSHTLHSRETLAYIENLAERWKLCRMLLDCGRKQYEKSHGTTLDLNRGWWTPPLAPFDAWTLERRNIERSLDKAALVSLTDHDDIEAPLALRVLNPCADLPISVEWTVPYGPTFFHLGVHNIQPERARAIAAKLQSFTAAGSTAELEEILASLACNPETLIVFNHPCWDEQGIGLETHVRWAGQFIKNYGTFIHALELNGLRPWSENREAIRMSYEWNKPMVSGGDRHALEPNTILDLTNARTFAEFVAQVRAGWTNVLVTRQYREPFRYRVLESLQETLAYREDHGRGWKRWSDRVFFRCKDEVVRSLTELFEEGTPLPVKPLTWSVSISRQRRLLRTFRPAFRKMEMEVV